MSLQTGANVLKNLPEKYIPIDFFIDKKGQWHLHGTPVDAHKALPKVDVVFNALHGEYGEDGQVQTLLDALRIPYTGSKTFASAMAMNKAVAKNFVKKEGIKTAHHKVLRKKEATAEKIHEIFRSIPHPAIVKPTALGSSVGVSIINNFHELEAALEKVFAVSDSALVEEFIKGKEGTCGVVEGLRDQAHYALFPIEIVPPKEADFFDYNAKYSGRSQEICPGNFSREESKLLQELAVKVHKVLGLRHYSRADFIVHPKRGIYFLEVNTLPGLTAESLLPKALTASGFNTPQFLDHLLTMALAG